MNSGMKDDPRHAALRGVLRLVGPLVALVGLVLTAIGIGSFVSAFGSSAFPRYFWCAIIGLPLLGLGGMITQFAFLGAIFRYQARELTPVARDTFDDLAQGTQQGVRTIARAVSQGIAEGSAGSGSQVTCRSCRAANARDARFCMKCGAALAPATT
jgi:hypothetical protein